MKRTTYIIVGMLLAGLVLMCGTIFYISTQMTKQSDYLLDITGEKKSVQLPECKVIRLKKETVFIEDNRGEKREQELRFDNVPFIVSPANSASGTFTYASGMDKYISMNQVGDTLNILFDFGKEQMEDKHRDVYWLFLRSVEGMNLTIPDNVQLLDSDLHGQELTVEGFNKDSLSIVTRSSYSITTVQNSNFKALSTCGGNWKFNSGRVDNLHVDLSMMGDWKVNDTFYIDTEYLYSIDTQRSFVNTGECRQVIWIPQSENASLNINLKQPARIIME